MKITKQVTLTERQWHLLIAVIHDRAVDAEDDGRDNSPESKVLWELYRQLGEQEGTVES
jgi:hypothetical protein